MSRAPGRHLLAVGLFVGSIVSAALLGGGCGRRPAPATTFDPDTVSEGFARSMAALMAPGTTRSFLVNERGELDNGVWRVVFVPSADGAPAGAPRVVAYEDRWLPIAHWRRRAGPVRWEFEAVALPADAPAESVLMVSVLARATNTGTAPVRARLEASLEPFGPGSSFLAPDAPRARPRAPGWAAGGSGGGMVAAWSERGQDRGGKLAEWLLAPGESRETRAVVSAYEVRAQHLKRWAGVAHVRRAAAARARWQSAVEDGARFRLHDGEVEAALRAARVVMLANRARLSGHWVAVGGPFHYRDLWLRDAARVIAALSVAGHGREARELADGLTLCAWPNGAFLSQRGQLDGTGQALWAFEQAALRPAPDTSVARLATLARRAFEWIEWQRGLGRRSGWPFGRMLPFVDPRDNELVNAQLVGNDAWAIAGHRSAARLLRAAGRAGEAAEVEQARSAYVQDFRDALARTRSADVPPSWQGKGRDWGNLTVGWPCGVLPAGEPRLAALAERVWRASGTPGLASYGTADSLHGYLGADLGTWALLAGRPADAERVLSAMLRWRSASGGAGETFSHSARDFATNLPPHPTASAALVMLVRNMLIHDDDDTLRLTLGARPTWWSGANLDRAPTRWGLIDLAFERRGTQAHWSWTGVPVWTSLTLPPGTTLASKPDAPLVAAAGGRVVLAPPGSREASVALAGGRP